MKRDMDLVRDLLLRIEEEPGLDGTHFHAFNNPAEFEGRSVAELAYHVDLLFGANLVKGTAGSEFPLVSSLTWEGHEFLDDIRDPAIWASVKEHSKTMASLSIAFIWDLAKAEIKRRLGLVP